MRLTEIKLYQIGPIKNLDIKLDKRPLVLMGKNGSGKSIVLSSISDSIHEYMHGVGFKDVLPAEGLGYKYYKTTSSRYIQVGRDRGVVFVEYETAGNKFVRYVEQYGYENANEVANDIGVDDAARIPAIDKDKAKNIIISGKKDKETRRSLFNEAIFVLPANRYEDDFWKSDVFQKRRKIKNFFPSNSYEGYLGRKIEITTSYEDNYRWLMDTLFDKWGNLPTAHMKMNNANQILKAILQNNKATFMPGPRRNDRISCAYEEKGKTITMVPSLEMLSLGQHVLLNTFLNILRLGDYNKPNNEITGIVVIDEIDVHLNTELQHKVLPELIRLFPKVQFILTTHSPMFLMGAKKAKLNLNIKDLPSGSNVDPEEFEEFEDAFEAFKSTRKFKDAAKIQVRKNPKPWLFVEDEKKEIYKIAWLKVNAINCTKDNFERLFQDKCMFEIYDKGGRSQLQGFLNAEKISELEQSKILGLFDFDEAYENFAELKNKWGPIKGEDISGLYRVRDDHKCFKAMLIPVPKFREYNANSELKQYSIVAIEHLFMDKTLNKMIPGIKRKKLQGKDNTIPVVTNKKNFWKKALELDNSKFDNFNPLFQQVEKLLEVSIEDNETSI